VLTANTAFARRTEKVIEIDGCVGALQREAVDAADQLKRDTATLEQVVAGKSVPAAGFPDEY
jgi:hypothetical protein